MMRFSLMLELTLSRTKLRIENPKLPAKRMNQWKAKKPVKKSKVKKVKNLRPMNLSTSAAERGENREKPPNRRSARNHRSKEIMKKDKKRRISPLTQLVRLMPTNLECAMIRKTMKMKSNLHVFTAFHFQSKRSSRSTFIC